MSKGQGSHHNKGRSYCPVHIPGMWPVKVTFPLIREQSLHEIFQLNNRK